MTGYCTRSLFSHGATRHANAVAGLEPYHMGWMKSTADGLRMWVRVSISVLMRPALFSISPTSTFCVRGGNLKDRRGTQCYDRISLPCGQVAYVGIKIRLDHGINSIQCKRGFGYRVPVEDPLNGRDLGGTSQVHEYVS